MGQEDAQETTSSIGTTTVFGESHQEVERGSPGWRYERDEQDKSAPQQGYDAGDATSLLANEMAIILLSFQLGGDLCPSS